MFFEGIEFEICTIVHGLRDMKGGVAATHALILVGVGEGGYGTPK